MTTRRVDRIAVENFLGSLDGLTYREASLNVDLDARSYGWNHATTAAIRCGLLRHYFPQQAAKFEALKERAAT